MLQEVMIKDDIDYSVLCDEVGHGSRISTCMPRFNLISIMNLRHRM